MNQSRPFDKQWVSVDSQLDILEERGMTIANRDTARQCLVHINYYRFSGYCLAFETTRHVFMPNVQFEHVYHAYEFDTRLRELITRALQVFEIDARAAIAQNFGREHGAFTHVKANAFSRIEKHQKWLETLRHHIKRSQELFVQHFKNQYDEYPDLPIWMATEVMTFGELSRMFKMMMKRPDQRKIARRYHRQPRDMESWLHHLNYLRNMCAHHARLWDRDWSIKPSLPAGKKWNTNPPLNPGKLHVSLLIIADLLLHCPNQSSFRKKWIEDMTQLLSSPPKTPSALKRMGMTPDWIQHPIWQQA